MALINCKAFSGHTASTTSVRSRRTAVRVEAVAKRDGDSKGFVPRLGAAIGSACLAVSLLAAGPGYADLNRFEYELEGEFGKGSAQQFAQMDINGEDFSGKDLRRSNFTSASAKKANFRNANLQGAFFMKAVVYQADFTGANLSDVLMDRAVINEAILRQANLTRAVLTRSDLTGSDIYGADFTNALVDKTQQLALCKYADGINEATGVSTRKSLGCGSARRFKASSPSSLDGPQVTDADKDAFKQTLPSYYNVK